ncbi:MAG: tRNA (adenosine(37)-N6)-threonylcarbamoyltransferase complex ATPase subunit type 1 TsaE [Streptosporangiales bacterium]|nr:tRNA (adenosine(37)-N6)-threonylcarbamoyltransferase complex ATPase subunit type 1 TsaE [Streptosporangiales bacterium]
MARPRLDPPAAALAETVDSVREALARNGGLLCTIDGEPVGALLLDPDGDGIWLRRVAVEPRFHKHGIASALVAYAEDLAAARGFDWVRVIARAELPGTVRFWRHRGFFDESADGTTLVLGRPLQVELQLPTPADTRALGRQLAAHVAPGDLLLLTGDLGAGKTTLVQGLAEGLDVRGQVTSPTFVIARVHRSRGDGPPLVHVDAYRLGGVAEVDDLDLDVVVEESVTVVEWGAGLVEELSDDRLELALTRPSGEETGDERTVRITRVGDRWRTTDLRKLGA